MQYSLKFGAHKLFFCSVNSDCKVFTFCKHSVTFKRILKKSRMLDCLCVLSLLQVNKNIRHLSDYTGLFFATPIMTLIGILVFSWKYTMHCHYTVFVSNLVQRSGLKTEHVRHSSNSTRELSLNYIVLTIRLKSGHS